jgi:hypothetical protein
VEGDVRAEDGALVQYLDASYLRRIRGLAFTEPLHELERNKTARPSMASFDLRGAALMALDLVVRNMGTEGGIGPEAARDQLTLLVAELHESEDPATCREVADHVIDQLLNVQAAMAVRQVPYRALNPRTGEPTTLLCDVRLLAEEERPDGSRHLLVPPAAINLLIGAFDADITSDQHAQEILVYTQLRTGRISRVGATAKSAMARSQQFSEELRLWLGAARQDITRVGGGDHIIRVVEEALAHIDERRRLETQILTVANLMLDETQSNRVGSVMTNIVDIIGGCRDRHMALHGQLMDVYPTLIREQERQRYAPPAPLRLIGLSRQVFDAFLGLRLGDAMRVAQAAAEAVCTGDAPLQPHLGALVMSLLQRPRALREGEEEETLEFDEEPATDSRFSLEALEEAAAMMTSVRPGDELGRLLGQIGAGPRSGQVSALCVLATLHAFDPDPAPDEMIHAADSRMLAPAGLRADRIGRRLLHPIFAGDDLVFREEGGE